MAPAGGEVEAGGLHGVTVNRGWDGDVGVVGEEVRLSFVDVLAGDYIAIASGVIGERAELRRRREVDILAV